MTYKELSSKKREIEREVKSAIIDLLENHFEDNTVCFMGYYYPELMPDDNEDGDIEEEFEWDYESADYLPYVTFFEGDNWGGRIYTSKCAQIWCSEWKSTTGKNIYFETEDSSCVSGNDVNLDSLIEILSVLEDMVKKNK